MGHTRASAAPDSGFSAGRFFLPSAGVTVVAVAGVIYLHAFAIETGLDSTLPAFGRHWYTFLAVELLVLVPVLQFGLVRIARTRCADCPKGQGGVPVADPAHERAHIWSHLSLVAAVVLCCNLLFGLVATHDGPWHQATFRDSALTPVHILMFYGMAPMMVTLIAASYLYGRTRLPSVWAHRKGVPMAYALWGSAFALVGVFTSLNEFGHTEWIFEEKISQQVHWPFLLAAFGLAGAFAVAIPDLRRLQELSGHLDPDALASER